MSANEDIVRKWFDALNSGKVDDMDQMVDEHLVDHSLLPGQLAGRQGHKQTIEQLIQAFANRQHTIVDISEQGDQVTVRHTMTGTHTGHFMGLIPDNLTKTFQIEDTVRIANGKIVEHWGRQNPVLGPLP